MDVISEGLVHNAYNRAYSLINYNIHNNIDEQHKFLQQTILDDESLTKYEKSYAIKLLNKDLDYYKIFLNNGTKRNCENCLLECLATSYCEHCIRNYLKEKFSNWSSGN